MIPIENHLQKCMDETVGEMEDMTNNQNYYAMSLKKFFILLGGSFPDMLEIICHNFVRQWVEKKNKRLDGVNNLTSKSQRQQRLETMRRSVDYTKNLYGDVQSRYMQRAASSSRDPKHIVQQNQSFIVERNWIQPSHVRSKTVNKSFYAEQEPIVEFDLDREERRAKV